MHVKQQNSLVCYRRLSYIICKTLKLFTYIVIVVLVIMHVKQQTSLVCYRRLSYIICKASSLFT